MPSKTNTEVILGGKVYTLSGYESEEYLQKVAAYINNKLKCFLFYQVKIATIKYRFTQSVRISFFLYRNIFL